MDVEKCSRCKKPFSFDTEKVDAGPVEGAPRILVYLPYCPHCGTRNMVDHDMTQEEFYAYYSLDASTDPGMKKCPDCAEWVRGDARVCRFCGYRFEPTPPQRQPRKRAR